MKNQQLQPDLLYCRHCRRHFRGKKRACPTDGQPLELVTAFVGHVGDVLDDRYVLCDLVGVGGMGTVFRALDRQQDRMVALKLLRAEYASNATSAQRFLQEAKLLRLIRHPTVVGLHRFSRTGDGTLLIDMELVDGESVRDRILRQGHGFDFGPAMVVLDQLLAGLAACHDAGVVHCDVKPENLMLPRGTDGQSAVAPMKLIDFGVAQPPGPVLQSDDVGVIGTPAYMSPEQVRGAAVDCRTDLYLVGCVAYELLTGEPPFTQTSALDLCHAQLLDKPPPLATRLPAETIPPGFEAWLQPLLEKDPAMRPATARIAREQLRVLRHAHRRRNQVQAYESTALSPEPLHADEVQVLRPESLAQLEARIAEQAQPSTLGATNPLDLQPKSTLKPPSAALLRRPGTTVRPLAPANRADLAFSAVRALVEVRQSPSHTGITYGPEAIEQISRHVLAGAMQELRDVGAVVQGPAGPHIEIHLDCGGDQRGAVSHLLDTLAAMQVQLARIPEPRLEMRAAVVADLPGSVVGLTGGLNPLDLLQVSPVTQVRVDEYVARWAGRRALVRLTSVPSPDRGKPTDVYATSLLPV